WRLLLHQPVELLLLRQSLAVAARGMPRRQGLQYFAFAVSFSVDMAEVVALRTHEIPQVVDVFVADVVGSDAGFFEFVFGDGAVVIGVGSSERAKEEGGFGGNQAVAEEVV